MKNLTIALILSLTSLSSLADTSASLVLKGVVPEIMSLSMASENLATNLPLQTSQNNSKVGTITEISNSKTGFKITAVSTNSGKLKRSNGSQTFDYRLFYQGQDLNLQNGTSVIVNSSPAAVNRTRDVTITYTGIPSEQLVAGDYTDTITFSIAAN